MELALSRRKAARSDKYKSYRTGPVELIRTSLIKLETRKKWLGTSLIKTERGQGRLVRAISSRIDRDHKDMPYQTGKKPKMIRNKPYQDRKKPGAICTSLVEPDCQIWFGQALSTGKVPEMIRNKPYHDGRMPGTISTSLIEPNSLKWYGLDFSTGKEPEMIWNKPYLDGRSPGAISASHIEPDR